MNVFVLVAAICACDLGDAVAKLGDADAKARDQSAIVVSLRRRDIEDGLLEQVKDVLANRDGAFNGRTHTVLQAVAAERADNTVAELVEAVDLTLDPDTFPRGDRRPTIAYYPVAQTLAELGNRVVIQEILSAAKKPRSDDVLRIYAWILNDILGKDVARAVVAEGRTVGFVVEFQRLPRLLKMVDEGLPLPMPGGKEKRNP